ncbi:hypothetical protein BST95_03525 [Halioglobus japonicus]|uniref:HAMP domain-containing protein n=1 Tax=Halioglobus japonicus TaxID=930805 RepID=A0AAP8SMT9_9GAMM|nr:SpoIIE family protein phosphatase [Halioglobus japonicus]AQA17444.1 hypothetical protein BST95_03525 [Halioglobus japonicus]PLW85368.1 HAMP domain-containing protein [Halioglobus japonicus]GHD22092.1 IcfG protein [Halioglobus japonicus]
MRGSISTRLIVLITLCTAVIVGGGMLLDYRVSRAEILERLDLESNERVKAVVVDIENWLSGVEAATGFLGQILSQREYSEEGLKQMLRDLVQGNEEIYGAAIALSPNQAESGEGFAPYFFHSDTGIAYANLASREADYQQQPWFRAPIETAKPVWSEPYFDNGGGEALMTTYSVPVYRIDEEGQRFLYAVVTADVLVEDLHRVLQQLHLGEHSNGLLLSTEGMLLSSRQAPEALRHYSEIAIAPENLKPWRDLLDHVRGGQAISREVECPEIEGQCTLRMGTLQSNGWPIGIVYSQNEVLEPLYNYQIKTVIISVCTILGMALVVSLVTHSITRPLSYLSAASANIARGNMDSPLPPAKGNDEIATLVRSFESMSKDLKTYIADLESVTASRSRLEGELAAAREIQMSMLPGAGEARLQQPPVDLWARVEPAKTVGGDLYTYSLNDNHLLLAVGDVSDKGVPAALFMARAISLIQQLSSLSVAPNEAMTWLNNSLERDNPSCMFVTLFLGVLNTTTGELRFATAGHTAPSLLRNNEVTVIDQDTGPALGLIPDQDYPDNLLTLCPADRLAIYTDGIDEAFNSAGEMFGVERFNKQLQNTGALDLAAAGAALFQAVASHAQEQPQSDDITLLLLEPSAGKHGSQRQSFDLAPGLTRRVQSWLEPVLNNWSVPDDAVMEMLLIAEELVTNVQKYGELQAKHEIAVTLRLDGQTLALQVRDPGVAFNPLAQAERADLGADIESAEIGGLGVHLITGLSNRQHYAREGEYNVLTIEKDLPVWT